MDKCCCVLALGAGRGIAVPMGAKKDDPPRVYRSHGRLLTEDRQDDVIADCWAGQEAPGVSRLVRRLFWSAGAAGVVGIYIQGQLSDVHRKTAEGIALEFDTAPRTLQRFLESIKWNHEQFHDQCQQIVAQIMLTRRRSAWWTSPPSPRAGTTRWASGGNGTATGARWITVSWGCI